MTQSALDALFERAADANRHGDLAGAEKLCREIIAADPHHLRALFALATIAYDRGDYAAAETYAVRLAVINPRIAEVQNLHGMAQAALGHLNDAAASFAAAAALMPDPTGALYNRGNILFTLGRFEDALSSYDAALARAPDDTIIVNNRGNTLRALNHASAALAAYDRAIALDPSFAGAHNNRGIALQMLGRFDEALASFDRAIGLDPNDAEARYNRGVALAGMKRFEDALASHEAALRLQPAHADAAGAAFGLAAILCDWQDWEKRASDIVARIRDGKAIAPLIVLGFNDDPALQALAARNAIKTLGTVVAEPLPVYPAHRRIRLAYLSADFRNHVVGHTLVDLFERLDRQRFELWGISLAPAPDSAIRRRLIVGFDHFIDAASLSDRATATLLREQEIDIAIDLMGHTENTRLGVFAFRAAPLQVNQFGYPGTDGADFIDYVIGDRIATHDALAGDFNERIVTLPDCYLPSAAMPPQSERPDRRVFGLPDEGFVFCNFNAPQKITPAVFEIWTRLLAQIDGSVLWLYTGEASQPNLRRAAEQHGIDPQRLIFAPPLERALHLARLGAADLFLDTMPYGAHNTAIETVWAGVPLVTCTGNSMAARAATSVLTAARLPELATPSLAAYETLALSLAREPDRLAALRQKLAASRAGSALFDLPRYCRHLETAYTTMWQRHRDGLAPAGFAVADQ
ncbi:MAG TPA: tetratricopeptide repeat protein [Stellaceae bacterium]|jgi:predicted O-linked N-acetylglucosamine transferase (SPINDLY family)|nr:tetratricopeptide repeat protein [Stellaceae bacterium]